MSEQLVYTCDKCEEPITKQDGWITCNEFNANECERKNAEYEQELTTEDGVLGFTTAEILKFNYEPWHVYHCSCDPKIGSGYWFDIVRCDTVDKLLVWTLHLSGKTWFSSTKWREFVNKHTDLPWGC